MFEQGQVVSHFRILEQVGEGGMGVVYRAHDLHLDRDVALKVISGRARKSDTAERRFRKEASALSRLNHPNIASIYDFDEHEGTPFIIMEWIPGRTLDAVVAGQTVDQRTLIDIGEQVSGALGYAHAQGVIHRDLKPGNLRMTADGVVKVLDFGLAKLWKNTSDSSATITFPGVREILGTLPYIAPEVIDGGPATVASDIYAFGAVLYEAATGTRAFPQSDFEALTAAILRHSPKPPRELNPQISESLDHVILKALEKNPADRYSSAHELRNDLRRIREGLPLIPSRKWRVPRRSLQAAAVVAIIVAALVLGLVNRKPQRTVPTMKALATTLADEWSPQISPDGAWISFLSDRGERVALWLQRVKGGDPIQLAADEGINSPIWSPDGESVAFLIIRLGDISVRIVPPFGGRPATTLRLPENFHDAHLIRWIESNIYLELRGQALYRLDTRNGALSKLADNNAPEGLRSGIDVSEDETQIVYQIKRGQQMTIWTAEITGEEATILTNGTHNDFAPRYAGDAIVFSSDRAGQADLWRMNATPDSEAEQITFSPAIEYVKDVSADQSLMTYLELREASNVWRTDIASGEHRQITSDALRDGWPSASRGANRLVMQRQRPTMAWTGRLYRAQILMSSLDTGGPRRSWTPVSEGGGARVSPDGNRVAFIRPAGEGYELRIRDVDLSHEWVVTNDLKVSRLYPFPQEWNRLNFVWADGGDEMLFVQRSAKGQESIGISSGDGLHLTLVAPVDGVAFGDLTPTEKGDRVAFVASPANGSGTSEIRLLDRSDDTQKRVWSMKHEWNESLFLRGWMPRDRLVALKASFNDDWSERTTVLVIGLDGSIREVATLPRAYAGTARIDPAARTLYVTAAGEDGTHNIVAVSTADGTTRKVTANEFPGISFGAVDLGDDGNLLYARQEINQDVWTIEFPRQ